MLQSRLEKQAFQEEMGLVNNAEVVSHIDDPSVVENAIIVGVVPLHIASKAAEVWYPILELQSRLEKQAFQDTKGRRNTNRGRNDSLVAIPPRKAGISRRHIFIHH